MPKLKTNRGAAKRFTRTAGGKFKRNKSHRRHILTKKIPSVSVICVKLPDIHAADEGLVKQMLPYA